VLKAALDAPQQGRKEALATFPFQLLSQIEYAPEKDRWVIAGLLPAEGLAVVYGKPKSKKSFIVLDIGVAVATGHPWGGMKTTKAPVVIVAGEGAAGMRKRIAAYRRHKHVPDDTPLVLISARPNLGSKKNDLEKLIATVERAFPDGRPGLIIIDTLSRMLHGEDENGEGMANFTEAAEAISEYFGCLTIAVHHQPHNGDRMRGHSSLPGAMVVGLQVKSENKLESSLLLEAAKDVEDSRSITVRFVIVEMGFDPALERQATTLLVDAVEFSDENPKPKTMALWERALQVFRNLLVDEPITSPKGRYFPSAPLVSVTRFREELVTCHVIDDDNEKSRRVQWHRIKKTLQDKGHIRMRGGYLWAAVSKRPKRNGT